MAPKARPTRRRVEGIIVDAGFMHDTPVPRASDWVAMGRDWDDGGLLGNAAVGKAIHCGLGGTAPKKYIFTGEVQTSLGPAWTLRHCSGAFVLLVRFPPTMTCTLCTMRSGTEVVIRAMSPGGNSVCICVHMHAR